MEEVKAIKAKQEELWNNTNRFHSQIRKEQEMLAREIQEVRKGQINHTLVNNQRAEAEKNLEQAANPNLSEISINHIPDLMQTNAERRRPMFYGALKSHHGASSSSQPDQQEPVPLRTAPPLPGYQPPRPPPN
ncbi:hypothetical protein PIB30_064267 [Stylosanthes scabra]|uniref:Uncharacterized protein n=1 Tax=Stylosanthes scabra TaxID=79078 RepID=A0ABU6ZKE2_9FABA|nr:hypothetical protein [Stylosanthes scabra]